MNRKILKLTLTAFALLMSLGFILGQAGKIEAGSNGKFEAPDQNLFAESEKPHNLIFAQKDRPFELSFGDTAWLEDQNLYVSFTEVIEDSRCPRRAMCVVAGAVEVELTLTQPGKAPVVGTLRMDGSEQRSWRELLPGYIFELYKVAPYPALGETIPLNSYVITLEITTRDIRPIDASTSMQ